MKNETTIDKAERMAENMMISWAIQEAINAKAVPISPEKMSSTIAENRLYCIYQTNQPDSL